MLDAEDDILVVGETADGREAARLARRYCPDIAVLDVHTTGLDGVEVAKRIKAKRLRTELIMLTDFGSDIHTQRFLRAGVVGCVPRSAVEKDLIDAVRTVARGGAFLYPESTRRIVETVRQWPPCGGGQPYDSAQTPTREGETQV
jgi:DNA-binding NarL/FixJ family response regulator